MSEGDLGFVLGLDDMDKSISDDSHDGYATEQEEEGGIENGTAKVETTTTNNQTQLKNSTKQTNGTREEEIGMEKEVNEQFSHPDEAPDIGGTSVSRISKHKWSMGQFEFQIHWSDDSESWETLRDLREDHPFMTARYIVNN
jgi:hypothetical protein